MSLLLLFSGQGTASPTPPAAPLICYPTSALVTRGLPDRGSTSGTGQIHHATSASVASNRTSATTTRRATSATSTRATTSATAIRITTGSTATRRVTGASATRRDTSSSYGC